MPDIFKKEMAITHIDFMRLLSRALGHDMFVLEDGKIVVEDKTRILEIRLSQQTERRIASLTFPVTFVSFEFSGYKDAAKEMARIDLHFQRGGG